MANAIVPVDPLDELRLLHPVVPDRLPAMLFLAALVHGILIIGITFNPEFANLSEAISLEVTIVADPDQDIDRPDEAAYLAQASQEGGGNTTDSVRPSAPLQSSMPADNLGQEDGNAVVDSKAHENMADEVLTTENDTDRDVSIDPRTDPQQQDTTAILMASGAEQTMPLPEEDEASLLLTDDDPRQLIISADTRDSVAAAYLDAWISRIEAVGAAYIPELGGVSNLRGSPTMLVRINKDGELIEATVARSSGSPVVDLASLDIIQRSAPFDEFPKEMTEEHDTVAFLYDFLFAQKLVNQE